jgi:AcrR family transcriptional regulator
MATSSAKRLTRSMVARGAAPRADEERTRIVDAAYRVIARRGSVDPTVRDILDEGGFSTPAFYRHFPSKDDLLLALLDDGRRQLNEYLGHRMENEPDGLGRVRAWIAGVAAQAVDPAAASRTRPFLANANRLAEQFPAEVQRSQEAALSLLLDAMTAAQREGRIHSRDLRRDAQRVYDLVFRFIERSVLAGVRPIPTDVTHLVAFCERALGAT